MMNKQILLIFGIMCCVFVTGCGKISNNVVFHTDGSVSEKLEVEGDRAASGFFRLDMNNEFNKLKSTFTEKNSNAKITDLNNGFLLERKSSDVKELVSKGGTLFNPSEDYGGLRYRKGYFFDTYSLDSVALGQKGNPALDILDGNNFNLNNPYEMAMYTTSKNYIDSAKATFSLSVPSPADYHNATASESDNTLLKWDMKPALLNGNDVPIKVNFRIYHYDNINTMRGAIIFCLIVSFVMLILKLVKKDVKIIQQFAHYISILFLITTVGLYFYLDNELKHPPHLTYADRIIKEGALDSEGRNMKLSVMRLETSAPNSLEKASKILKEHGYKEEKVEAVSTQDEDGFLAFASVENEGGVPIFLYDAKYNIVAEIFGPRVGNSFLYDFRKDYNIYDNGKIDFNPAIFTVFIPNEKRGDIDDNLGTWSNGGHSIPIYALFKVDTKSDKVITDAIYSGSGTVNPSHYHSDVHNEKYIHIVNTIITHIDSLRLDMKLRERQKKQ